jgi:hypothetical protein
MWLDDRWRTGFWDGPEAPCPPGGLCDACGRRAATGSDLVSRQPPGRACAWCNLGFEPIDDKRSLDRALDAAKASSISWRWRYE